MEFLPLLVVGVLMYAVLVLPQQRRAKAHRQLLESLEEGDEVVTSSGMYGFVNAVDGDVVWVEAAEGVELKLTKSAISSKVPAPGDDNEVADGDGDEETDEE